MAFKTLGYELPVSNKMKMTLEAFENVKEITPGEDLADVIFDSASRNRWQWHNRDIIVLAQKIVSKAEGRLVNLKTVKPSPQAIKYAQYVDKDVRLIELILQESRRVLRTRAGLMIVQHKLGFICANAGIDHSNISIDGNLSEDFVLLLPENPDQSAENLRTRLLQLTGKQIGVLIIDSHGRAWRKGVVGISIGFSGIPAIINLRGRKDRNNYSLKITEISPVDELSAAASLLMGQADEGRPLVAVRGFPYDLRDSNLSEVIREENLDLFR